MCRDIMHGLLISIFVLTLASCSDDPEVRYITVDNDTSAADDNDNDGGAADDDDVDDADDVGARPNPTPEPENQAPSVIVSPGQTVTANETVFLSGNATDVDGQIVSTEWEQISGPSVDILNGTSLQASFRAPVVGGNDEQLRFRLTVTDDDGAETISDEVIISIDGDSSPIAVAGDDRFVAQGSEVELDAIDSSDPDGRIIAYSWRQVRGEAVDLVNANNANVIFDAPEVFRTQDLLFELTVTDDSGNTATDEIIVTVIGELEETPLDPDKFITFLNEDSPLFENNDDVAEAYYDVIDPDNDRTNLNDWLDVNGFSDDDIRVPFFNRNEIGAGRLMSTRTLANGDIAAYVEIYPTLEDAVEAFEDNNQDNIILTVATEFSPDEDDVTETPFTKFYAFNANGNRVESVDVDGRGDKALPGACNVCHGGEPEAIVAGIFPNDGNTGATFLPVDLSALEFDDSPGLRREDLEIDLREFNRTILETVPEENFFIDSNAGLYSGDAVRDLIEGWYGGEGLPRNTFDDEYVPPGWLPSNQGGPRENPLDADAFYLEVIAPHCRSCHILRGTDLEDTVDFSSYSKLMDLRDRVEQLVFQEGRMPNSLVSWDAFWLEEDGASAAAKLGAQIGVDPSGERGTLPGVPVAKPAAPADAPTDELIPLNGLGSQFAELFEWDLIGLPPGSNAEIIGAQSAEAFLDADVDGEYEVVLRVVNEDNDVSDPAIVRIFAIDNLQPVNFEDEIRPMVLQNCAAQCHNVAGIQGIPVVFDNEATDFEFMTQYINFNDPLASPILTNPSGQSHGGGVIRGFDLEGGNQSNYDLMLRWILEGAEQN